MKKRQTKLPIPLPVQPEELDALQLKTKIGIADWALQNRKLSRKTSRFHGEWSHEYTPFMIEPMNSLSDSTIGQVTIVASAQSAKTEVGLNFLGWIVDQSPKPTLVVMPTESDTKRRVATRIKPLFESTPILLKHIGGNSDNINLIDATILDNMLLYLGWSGSASILADNPICYAIIDEPGKFPSRIRNEADPVSLIKDRTTTFGPEAKIYMCSTPTIEGDLVDREYKLGDKRQWWAQCSYCKRYHVLKWANVKIETLDDGNFLAPEDYENGEHAWYVCPHCKKQWSESDRWEAVSAGKWIPESCTIDKNGVIVGNIPDTRKRSYKITALMLYPGFMTISKLASEWVEANIAKKTGDIGPLQNFINSRLAEPWKETEKVTSDSKLKKHVGSYPAGEVQEGIQLITCGVDVQQDHVWVSVEGWGYLSEVWTIYQGRLEIGDTSNINNYELLRQFLHTPWPLANNQKQVMYIAKTAIDCGFRTDVIYDFCRKCTELDVIPVMGDGGITRAPFRAAKIAGGTRIRYDINVLMFKNRLYRLMFESKQSGAGFWHFPSDTPEDYLNQLCSEEQRPETKRGKNPPRMIWVMKSGATANHLWDCSVYSTFAAELAGARSLWSPEQIAAYQARKVKRKPRNVQTEAGFLDDLPQL